MIEPPELTCREFVELVTDFLADHLSSAERQRVAAHLLSCAHCVVYLEQMRRTIWLLRVLGGESVPAASPKRPW